MAITKIIDNIDLNSTWAKVSLGDLNSFYMIAIKEAKGLQDTVDPADVKAVVLEMGIESGITDKMLSIGRIVLNFDEITSSDVEVNKITAMVKRLHEPSEFYIRPIEIITNKETLKKEAKTSIDININTVKLC